MKSDCAFFLYQDIICLLLYSKTGQQSDFMVSQIFCYIERALVPETTSSFVCFPVLIDFSFVFCVVLLWFLGSEFRVLMSITISA
jgi:hypothetical protein